MSTRGGGLLSMEKVYNFNQNPRTRKEEMQSEMSRIKEVEKGKQQLEKENNWRNFDDK